MVLNMTELSIAQGPTLSSMQHERCAQMALFMIGHYLTIVPTDSSVRVRVLAWDTADTVMTMKPEAVILQGEPVFVNAFLERYGTRIQCFSALL